MVETINFRVGADLGIRLMEISQEHLLYNADIEKAKNVFDHSFGGGCPTDILYKLLVGDMVVQVGEESQEFLVVDREAHHDKIFPARLNLKDFFREKEKQLDAHCRDFTNGLIIMTKDLRSNNYNFNFSIESVVNYLYGDSEDMVKELKEDFYLSHSKTLIKTINALITKTLEFSNLRKELQKIYPNEKLEFDTSSMTTLANKLIAVGNLDLDFYGEEEDNNPMLDNYLNAVQENDEITSKGIEPVNIMDNYSAGYLSPKGDYYALNGEIANMLHLAIASSLVEKGVIPNLKDEDNFTSPDGWLEQQGWVKIHGNNIQFAGCNNHKLGMENVHMTDVQKKMIYEYISLCHGAIVRAGWKMKVVSSIRFRETEDLMLARNYFNYD